MEDAEEEAEAPAVAAVTSTSSAPPQTRHVPPPVLKGPKVEDFQRYEIRLRKWQTILAGIPRNQRAVAAHYALLESENKEVVDMAESIEDSVVDHEDGIDRLLAALKEHIMPKNAYEKYIQFENTFFGTRRASSESYQAHGIRLKTAFTKLTALGVTVDAEVQGFFLLRQTGLDKQDRMAIMIQTQGSLEYNKVREALKGLRDDASLVRLQQDHMSNRGATPPPPKRYSAYAADETVSREAGSSDEQLNPAARWSVP